MSTVINRAYKRLSTSHSSKVVELLRSSDKSAICALGLQISDEPIEICGHLFDSFGNAVGLVREHWRIEPLRAKCIGCSAAEVIFNLHRAQEYAVPRFVWLTHSVLDCCRLWAEGERRVVAILHHRVSPKHIQLLLQGFGYVRIVLWTGTEHAEWARRARRVLSRRLRCEEIIVRS